MERIDTEMIPGFPHDRNANTALADYVWLPLRFTDNGGVVIDCLDQWSPDDYE